MPSFWVNSEDVGDVQLVLRDDEAHHLQRVRRLRLGDVVEVVDGEGQYYLARLVEISRSEVVADILERRSEYGESAVKLLLAPALIKGQRFDFVVEKATEVGVAEILPVLSERGIARNRSENKIERWQRLARAATKQCGRSHSPHLHQAEVLENVVGQLQQRCDLVLMATLDGINESLQSCLAAGADLEAVGLLVGPEGGFSPAEVEWAQSVDVRCFSWGPRILRADTASVVLAALVLHESVLRTATSEGGNLAT